MIDILIHGGTVVTVDAERRVIDNGAVAVHQGCILVVGSSDELLDQYAAQRLMDARRKLVMPGLIDSHGHAGHGLVKTLGGDDGEAWYRACETIYAHGSSGDFWHAEALLTTLGRHPAEIPLALASRELWHQIRELVNDDCGFVPCGQVKIAETEADLAVLRGRLETLHGLGFHHEVLVDAGTLREIVPAVNPACVGGLWVADDGAANPYHTTLAFRHAAARAGAVFHEGTRVLGIDRVGERWQVRSSAGVFHADTLVNCAGAWGGELSAMLGDPVPLTPIAPMLMVTARMPSFITPTAGVVGRPLSFKQMENGTVIIGGGHLGTPYPAENRTRLDFHKLALSAQTAADVFPIMAGTHIVRCWAGIEGCMPDEIPVIGPGSAPGVVHAFGFSAHGFQLGPVVGGIVADLVTTGSSNLPIDAFAVERRFSGGTAKCQL